MSLFICPVHGLHHGPFCCDQPQEWWDGIVRVSRMTPDASKNSCLLQHIDWREKHPDRPVDEPQLAHQLGMDLEEFHARIEALKKARLSITPPNSDLDGIGEGK